MKDGQLTLYGRPTWVLATTPLVGDGLQVGDLWVDLFIPITKRCTSISPVTFEVIEGGDAGETNTATNVGLTGTSIVEGKVGVDLQFRSVTAASTKLSVSNNAGNKSVDIDVTQANLDHGSIGGLADDDHTQYHTDGRANTWLGTKSTTDLAEGLNLYYTTARVDTWLGTKTTANLAENTNLYFTNERVDDRVAALIVNSATVTWVYDDGANTLTATSTGSGGLTHEQIMTRVSLGI